MSKRWTPEIVGNGLVTFAVLYTPCPICGEKMVSKPETRSKTFPVWVYNDFSAQAKRAGLVMMSDVMVDRHFICMPCFDSGKATFLCHLCKEKKQTNKIQDSFGDSSLFLCVDCYETAPAKMWEEARGELNERHKYDY